MFTSARLKLTAWYLLIIILISLSFSLAIYALINDDYARMEQGLRIRQEREEQLGPLFEEFRRQREVQGLPVPPLPQTELENINLARSRLQTNLLFINLIILGISGFAGYFLAGRTLRPIKQMVDEQNRFITDASHELRTPLTSLKSEIEVNLREKKLSLWDAKKLLLSNLEEVNKLQYLSDNLIKLTQHQNYNGRDKFEAVSLTLVVDEAIKKVSRLAKHKQVAIKNNIKNYALEGDKQSLVELFVILLDNAIKYSPSKSQISLSSKTFQPSVILSGAKDLKINNLSEACLFLMKKVEIPHLRRREALPHFTRNDKWVEIKVADQGSGISKEDIPHLFDRFYRADNSRSGTDGYGLGLAIAKQIIEKHEGMIKVESEINKGTTFIIQLPLG